MNPSSSLTRRGVLKGAVAGAVAVAAPVRLFDESAAAAAASNGIFGYGVASGDPTADSVVIWTRATPPARPGEPVATPGSGRGQPLQVHWDVARDPSFERIVAKGHLKTSAHPDPRVEPSVETAYRISWQTRAGSRRVTPAVGPVGARSDQPR